MGYAVVAFTITETGTVENAVPLEGFCGDPTNPETVFRPCLYL
jgi:protein TonB